jgi:outer membrane protein insertion porin family
LFRSRIFLALVFALVHQYALALEPFVIKDIRVEGLQRTEPGAVFNYLPVEVGDTMDAVKATRAIKSLYGTGYFKDVRVESDGDILLITVQERSAIAKIEFSGNRSFPSDKMTEGLRQVGISEGLIFDKSELDRAEKEIKRQYLSTGKYGATVTTVVSPLERNRVAVRFEIKEGKVAKIRDVNIVGNEDFTLEDLRAEFMLSTQNWMSWWNKDDQYSKQKLTADLESLKSFYLNQGYLEFAVNSTQVAISPDKQDIFITVNITEGEKYTISDVKLAGELKVPEAQLKKLIKFKAGDTFNRQMLTEASKAIGDELSNEGFAFANVNPIPDIDKEALTAAFTFFVDPGRRVYVRRINLTGNIKTKDNALRRELRQLESSWYAGNKIKRSKERLDRTQFFDKVSIETPSVPGSTDQVDLNISVAEKATGSVQFGAGFSSNDGLTFGFNINQVNFLGTGNRVNAQLNTSKVNTVYSLSYTNPYFTPDGISRGLDIYRRDVDTGTQQTSQIGTYNSSSYGLGVRFGVPLTEKSRFSFGLTGDITRLDLAATSPKQYLDFCGSLTGCDANSVQVSAGWVYDSRDNLLFPNRGTYQRLTVELGVPGLDLEYYKLEYKHAWFKDDIFKDTVFMLNGELGYAGSYGDGEYPFFKNFFAGGVNSIRGFQNGTLGPRDLDPGTGSNYSVGGTVRAVGNAEVFFPVPFIQDSSKFRISAFLDGGVVYGKDQSKGLDGLRYSTGVGISWFSPFGPLKLVLAKPLNEEVGDETQTVQFQLGQQF